MIKIYTTQSEHTLSENNFLLNDVNFPDHIEHSYNPHNVKAWVIGNEYGALCTVWACCEQDAFDTAADNALLNSMMAENQDYNNHSLTSLGNASELFDLSYAWIYPVVWDAKRDIHLIIKILREYLDGKDTL